VNTAFPRRLPRSPSLSLAHSFARRACLLCLLCLLWLLCYSATLLLAALARLHVCSAWPAASYPVGPSAVLSVLSVLFFLSFLSVCCPAPGSREPTRNSRLTTHDSLQTLTGLLTPHWRQSLYRFRSHVLYSAALYFTIIIFQ